MQTPTTIDVSAVEAMGFSVEIIPNDENRAYVLRGARNTQYELWRNKPNPNMLFVMNFGPNAKMPGVGKAKGYAWFTDRDGKLRPAR